MIISLFVCLSFVFVDHTEITPLTVTGIVQGQSEVRDIVNV